MADTEQDFKEWMDQRGLTAEEVGKALDVSPQTVKNWRSVGVPERRQAHVRYFMSTWSGVPASNNAPAFQPLMVHATREQFRNWESAARHEGYNHLEDWAQEGLDKLAKEWEQGGLKTLPDPEPIRSARVAEGEN